MTKREFASAVRAWAWREPAPDEWKEMWQHHTTFPKVPVQVIVSKHMPQKETEGATCDRSIDNRIIPAEHVAQAISLQELAAFSKAMQERFK